MASENEFGLVHYSCRKNWFYIHLMTTQEQLGTIMLIQISDNKQA